MSMLERGKKFLAHLATLKAYHRTGSTFPGASRPLPASRCGIRTPFVRTCILSALLVAAAIPLASCISADAQKKASYHYQMGVSFLGENNYTAALVELSEAEKITPDDPALLNKLALAYYYKKKYDIAENRYLKALSIKPDFSEARNNLGLDYLDMGRWDDAIQQFKMVIDDVFFREQETATINLGLAYFGKGNLVESLALLRGVVSNNPQNLRGRLNLGRLYFAMDRPELAIGEFKKALEINRDFAMAHYQLAMVYLKQKDHALAAASFREVVRLVPDSEIGQLSREYLAAIK
jgi:Tfp pilus assembly protein PilF